MASSPLQKLEEIEKTCRVCGHSTSMRCSRCGIVYYCSKEHIAQDWKRHKPGCNLTSATAPAQGEGNGQHILQAILLPVDGDTPRLIDVVSEKKYDEDEGAIWYSPKIKHFFPEMSAVRDVPIQRMGINGPTLEQDQCLALLHDDNSLINGSPVNRCVQRLTNGKARHQWSGNLFVLRLHPRDTLATKYRSVIMNEDIGPVRRYLEDYLTVMPNSSLF